MELVLGRNFLGRLVSPKGVKSHAGLKIRGKIRSFSNLVFLLQRMEYTISPCPIFRDHLTDHLDDGNLTGFPYCLTHALYSHAGARLGSFL
jgi:hypothetical protein